MFHKNTMKNKINITRPCFVLFFAFVFLFSNLRLANAQSGYPIYTVDNSLFSYSSPANRGMSSIRTSVANNGGSLVVGNWNTVSGAQNLFSNITSQFSQIPPGSVVITRYTGHGSPTGFTRYSQEISRDQYMAHVYNEAVKNDLHAIVINEDCYGARACGFVKPEYLEDGRVTVFTGSENPGATTYGYNGATYFGKIIANQEAIDTNKDGKVTYGEWQKWAEQYDKENYRPGNIGNPDAVLFHRSDVAPYDLNICIHPKPGQDDGDGFGPMFANEDVYDPDTQQNILGETIAQMKARGLIPKQEGTESKEGNYAARKNRMGHLRDNFPKFEAKSHQGDDDEQDAGKGPTSNYQFDLSKAQQSAGGKKVNILWSSGGYNRPLSVSQMMDAIRDKNHAYKASGSDIAVQPAFYSVGRRFPLSAQASGQSDTWVIAEKDGAEGCKFRTLTDEEKKAMFSPPQANFGGNQGGSNGGGGGGEQGGINEAISQLMDALGGILGQQQPQSSAQPQNSDSVPANGFCEKGMQAYCTKNNESVCLANNVDWSKASEIKKIGECETAQQSKTGLSTSNAKTAENLVNIISMVAESGIPKSVIESVINTIAGLMAQLF